VKRARRTLLDTRLTQYTQSNTQKLVSRIFSSDTQRPSGVYEWQIPVPSVLPMPPVPSELRLVAPLEAQEASYLAASARIASFSMAFIARL
jgi:hypothetical protein